MSFPETANSHDDFSIANNDMLQTIMKQHT